MTSGFPSQRASSAENVSIWCHHHDGTHISTLNESCIYHKLWTFKMFSPYSSLTFPMLCSQPGYHHLSWCLDSVNDRVIRRYDTDDITDCSISGYEYYQYQCHITIVFNSPRQKWHIYTSANQAIFDSANGLLIVLCQAIIWINAGELLNGPWGINLSIVWMKSTIISFKKCIKNAVRRMVVTLFWPQCVKLSLVCRWRKLYSSNNAIL